MVSKFLTQAKTVFLQGDGPVPPVLQPLMAAPVMPAPTPTVVAPAVQLSEAAELRGGPVPMVPWYSGIAGDAPVVAKAREGKEFSLPSRPKWRRCAKCAKNFRVHQPSASPRLRKCSKK